MTVPAFQRLLPGLALCVGVSLAALLIERIEAVAVGKVWLEALVIAILLGAIVHTIWTPPKSFAPGIQCAAKLLLEIAVVLMGASLNFSSIAAAGVPLLLAIVGTVVCAIVASFLIGRLIGLPAKMALLVACGNAICGNSAIAAVAPVIDAKADDVATSIAFTAVLSIVVVVALPLIADRLQLSAEAGGILAGLTVYAVPQVLAAAAPMGTVAVQIGTLVKLVRVLMLGPLIAVLSLLRTRRAASEGPTAAPYSIWRLVPPFILGFLALAAINSFGLFPQALAAPTRELSGLLTIMAMAGLGLGVNLRSVSAAGPRVIFVVTASLVLLGCMAFATLRMMNLT